MKYKYLFLAGEELMKAMKVRLMLVMGYLGAVIGAGFASWQEIVQFFVAYELYGMKGALVATGLFALCGGGCSCIWLIVGRYLIIRTC